MICPKLTARYEWLHILVSAARLALAVIGLLTLPCINAADVVPHHHCCRQDEFWIACDACDFWYCGKCAKVCILGHILFPCI